METSKSRDYDKEFKTNAVRLHIEGGRSVLQLCEELGVPRSTLSKWISCYKKDGQEAFPGKGHLNSNDVELFQLRKELAVAREERDILKKALGIFSSLRK